MYHIYFLASIGQFCFGCAAVPATICIRGNTKSMVEINFLCVHKKLRSKRLTPLLIKVSRGSAEDTDVLMSHKFARNRALSCQQNSFCHMLLHTCDTYVANAEKGC